MKEIERIAALPRQTFEGAPYHGPLLIGTLRDVPAGFSARRLHWSAHSIWQIVVHLAADLEHAEAVLEGSAGPWVEGETTWPRVGETSEEAWGAAVGRPRRAVLGLVQHGLCGGYAPYQSLNSFGGTRGMKPP